MEMNALFENILTEEDLKWRVRLEAEADEHKRNNSRLGNGDILMKLAEILRLANSVLTRFTERVLGKDRAIVFEREMAELDTLAHLKAAVEQKAAELKVKETQLQEAQRQLEILKGKLN